MFMKSLCTAVVVVLLVGFGLAPSGFAHDLVEGTLGTGDRAVDVWQIVCPTGTVRLATDLCSLDDEAGPLTLSILKASGGSIGKVVLQHIPEATCTPVTTSSAGPGTYFIMVQKQLGNTTSQSYDSYQECHNAAGQTLPHSTHKLVQDR
jgi:hypothetical protein